MVADEDRDGKTRGILTILTNSVKSYARCSCIGKNEKARQKESRGRLIVYPDKESVGMSFATMAE